MDELDPTFGNAGMATVDNDGLQMSAFWEVNVQPDGKLVFLGETFDGPVVGRVHSDGEPDHGFGTGGFVHFPYGESVNFIQYHTSSAALTPDGGIVVATTVRAAGSGSPKAMVAKLLSDGQLDTSFANNGIYTPTDDVPSSVRMLAVQSDGKIVVGSSSFFRLTAAGEFDTTFGVDGVVNLGSLTMADLAVAPDDRLLITGHHCCHAVHNNVIAVARLTADGVFDASFGDAGVALDLATSSDGIEAGGLELAPDGSIYVAMTRPKPDGEGTTFAIARFSADGALDRSFGEEGWLLDGGTGSRAADIAVQSDGKVIAVGYGNWERLSPASMARFNVDGSLDTDFLTNGTLPTTVADILGVTVAPDGSIVTVGNSGVQRRRADGHADPAFTSHRLSPARGYQRATALGIQADGKLVVAGEISHGGGMGITRLTPGGEVDTTFGPPHFQHLNGAALPRLIVFDPAGGMLLAGWDGSAGFSVVRVSSNGLPSEDGEGALVLSPGPLAHASYVRPSAIALGGDTRLYVGGYFTEELVYWGIVRSDTAGQVDTSWGDAGLSAFELPEARHLDATQPMRMVELADGSVVVAAHKVMHRLSASGELVRSFGVDGTVEVGEVVALQAVGDELLVVTIEPPLTWSTAPRALTLRRYDVHGAVDTNFGVAGSVEFEAQMAKEFPFGLVVTDDGGIMVGTATGGPFRQDATLYRWSLNGEPDATFGDNGRLVMALSPHNSAFHALGVTADGKVVAAGSAWTYEGGHDFAVVRLR